MYPVTSFVLAVAILPSDNVITLLDTVNVVPGITINCVGVILPKFALLTVKLIVLNDIFK